MSEIFAVVASKGRVCIYVLKCLTIHKNKNFSDKHFTYMNIYVLFPNLNGNKHSIVIIFIQISIYLQITFLFHINSFILLK